ncbi:MAG: hypothetical protein HC915_01520 [Anaerolineae bacterium]|nr:hypothetical protein [Anaerolineae bacterium]
MHRTRYYDPALGVWLSEDPLELGNRYVYVNPVNLVDPTGMFGKLPEDSVQVCRQTSACQPGSLELNTFTSNGIRLTVACGATYKGEPFVDWTKHPNIIARVESALRDIIARKAFPNLELRYVGGHDAQFPNSTALTDTRNLVKWYEAGATQLDTSDDERRIVVVHELGRVLEKRNNPAMLNEAKSYMIQTYERLETLDLTIFSDQFGPIVVPIGLGESIKEKAEWLTSTRETPVKQEYRQNYRQGSYQLSGDPFINEYIADMFVFWIYPFVLKDRPFGAYDLEQGSPEEILERRAIGRARAYGQIN